MSSTIGPYTVGGGIGPYDYSVQVSGTIDWAEGSFPLVTGVSASGYFQYDNDFSLQLNATSSPGASLCSGSKNPNCKLWQQFVYTPGGVPPPDFQRAGCDDGTQGCIWIEYWLPYYGSTDDCLALRDAVGGMWTPRGLPDKQYNYSCYRNSDRGMPVPLQAVTNLANVSLTGVAGSGGDAVVLSVGGTIYAYAQSPSVMNLGSSGWNTAEFNIFGNGGSYVFSDALHPSNNVEIVVQTLTDSTGSASCLLASGTAEDNDLTLVPNSCCAIQGDLPGIQFMESNASPLPSPQACPLLPTDANWTTVAHPFDGVVTGTDTDGAPLYSCRVNYQGGVYPGKTRSDWAFCDIGRGRQIQPYETLVAAWTDETNGTVPSNAYAFGNDGSNGNQGPTLYPCRAYLDGLGLQLGKVRPGLWGCRIPYGWQEVVATTYQVLTTTFSLTTRTINSANPPSDALVGGYDSDESSTPFYLCQAQYPPGGGYVPGKVRKTWSSCDVSYGGTEHYVSTYNVLVPDFEPQVGAVFPAGYLSVGGPVYTIGICQASYQNSMQVGTYTEGASPAGCSLGNVLVYDGYRVLGGVQAPQPPPVPLPAGWDGLWLLTFALFAGLGVRHIRARTR